MLKANNLPPSVKVLIWAFVVVGLLSLGVIGGIKYQRDQQKLSNSERRALDSEKLVPIETRHERLKSEDKERAQKIIEHPDPVLDAVIPDDVMQSFRNKVDRARERANTPLFIRELTGRGSDSGTDTDLDRQTDNDFD